MQGVFQYNDKKYQVNVSLQNADVQEFSVTTLAPEQIGTIEYTNTLNDLVHSGSMEYADNDHRIDKFLDRTFVYCTISLCELKEKSDGDISDSKPGDVLQVRFFVNNIGIIKNVPGIITYKLMFSSPTWMNCIRKMVYTNYGKGKEPLFDIVKSILTQAKFNIDAQSFTNAQSVVKMNYITNDNDDVITSLRYLFNKMQFQSSYGMDSSVKGLIYDEYTDKVHAFDTDVCSPYQGNYSVVVNQVKNDINPVTNQKVNLAYNVKQDKTQVLQTMTRNTIYSYSLDSNEFSSEVIGTNQIMNYYHANNKNPKVKALADEGEYGKFQMDWNNNTNIYWDQMENLKKYGGLILNAPGKIGLIPGWIIAVAMPIAEEAIQAQDKSKQLEEEMAYKAMCGAWVASSVTNFINPSKGIFRQNISLMRNTKGTDQA